MRGTVGADQSGAVEREALAARVRFFEKDALLLKKHPERYRKLFLREAHYAQTPGFADHFLRGAAKYGVQLDDFYVSHLRSRQSRATEGLTLLAVPAREDARDREELVEVRVDVVVVGVPAAGTVETARNPGRPEVRRVVARVALRQPHTQVLDVASGHATSDRSRR